MLNNNDQNNEVRYVWLKWLGIIGCAVLEVAALASGFGLALGAFGISIGIPLVGSVLAAGSWLAAAVSALGAALPVSLAAIGGIVIAALAIWGIVKLLESLRSKEQEQAMRW